MLISSLLVTCLLIWLFIQPTVADIPVKYDMGISTGSTLLRMDNADLVNRLKDIKNLGANWIRVDFSWPMIQPDNSTDYHWDRYDTIVRTASFYNLKVLAILDYTPRWARDVACQSAAGSEELAQKCSPKNSEEFANFARAAARRYRQHQVSAWEIWNEPNLTAYWKTPQKDNTMFVDPVAYARIANAAATEIRRYTTAAIITGGLSPLFEPSRTTGMRQSDYLEKILPHLTSNLFDGVGMHPYSWPVLPTKAASYNAFYTINNGSSDYNLRTIMEAAGWGSKQIWATEFGASTKGLLLTEHPTVQKRPDHVTEVAQARIDAQGIVDWYTKPVTGPLFIYTDSDQWLIANTNQSGFGLRRSDGTKKPAYDAVKIAIDQIRSQK